MGASAKVTLSGGVVTQIVFTDAANVEQTVTCTNCDFHIDSSFTLVGEYSISGYVYNDPDRNGGTYTSGEDLPLSGVTVYLWQGSTLLGTTTTAGDGSYTFTGLPEGTYVTSINSNAPQFEGATEITTLDAAPQSYLFSEIGDGENNDYNDEDGNAVHRDFGFYWTPTAVDLIRFEAAPQGTAILITWETAMELDNLGFNLYRSENAAGPWTRVNAELIPAQHPGAVFGAVYEVLDAEVTAGVITYYRLEDVDIFGVSTFHGPISATPTGPTAATVVGFAAQGAPGLGLGLLLVAAFGLTLKRRR